MADSTLVEWSDSVGPWDVAGGTELYNGSGESTTQSSLAPGTTRYYQAWSWNASDGVWSDSFSSSFAMTDLNNPPTLGTPTPGNGSTDVERPPAELSAIVEDQDGDNMNVYIRWKRHDYYHFGEWNTIQTYSSVGDGTYNFVPPTDTNDWIWGNTTFNWSVNVTDGILWTNETYQFITNGSRYDINNDSTVNFQDAGLVWVHRTSDVDYDGIYDVNQDGQVNFQDAGITWINRD